jgi:hypothetical protein
MSTITSSTSLEESFDILKGTPPPSTKTETEIFTVPGLDGYGAQTLGDKDSEFELVTIRYFSGGDDNGGDANTHISDCCGMQGFVCTIVDDWGDTFTQILVTKVNTQDAKKPVTKDGDATAVRVELKWKCVNLNNTD